MCKKREMSRLWHTQTDEQWKVVQYRVMQRDCKLLYFCDGIKKLEKCTNLTIFRELIKGGFAVWMPNVSQVPTIFSFQRIDFWAGWHPLHARNSALEVILPSLLSNPPSSFSSTESLSPLQLRRAFGTKFHPKNPRKVSQQVQFQRVIDNFIKTASLRPHPGQK